METSWIADCESHFSVLVPRNFGVVGRAGLLGFGALRMGSIEGSQGKASHEDRADFLSGRAKPYEHSTADRP
ncbi:MAG: hypothetical protein DMF32_00105 [Verrucomicrobia bacterium]|nr:MAG: hypothetical protein DMF32_00105 [Verrucomicrobiota bacterium]